MDQCVTRSALIWRSALIGIGLCLAATAVSAAQVIEGRHPVSQQHPRLLGPLQRLQQLKEVRPEAYGRMEQVAREQEAEDHAKMISLALVSAVEGDAALGRQAVEMALQYVDGPIRTGHVTFGADLALCALVYDLAYESWNVEERQRFIAYFNKTVDANVKSETHVFHNGWYAYKNWGIGLAAYATYYDNPRSKEILRELEEEFLQRAGPALEMAGNGGGWGEGYYVNYWLYEWVFFCEVARYCEGVDYYKLAPSFFTQRAVAAMFETYPGVRIYGSRRSVPMGDGGGRVFGGDRDESLAVRRILASRFRDDAAHQAVHAFNQRTPRSSVGVYAYKDFLWHDETITEGDIEGFKQSHFSAGPGYVYARSGWDEDATYFFFKAGDRFTAHQHLDVGHFLIYKGEELLGDAGHYDAFSSVHAVNFYVRTIAHNTVLVHDPDEKFPAIRAGKVTGNDGGQSHNWKHHNGAVSDPAAWLRDREDYDIADITAFEERGDYLYIAADCSRAYAAEKLELFTRQIYYIRPGTFVVFDRVKATRPELAKTWLLQTMQEPQGAGADFTVTNGAGKLFVQTLLPQNTGVRFVQGADLYSYGGESYPPSQERHPAPVCRVEITPTEAAETDYFLAVLTATDSGTVSVPRATVQTVGDEVRLALGQRRISFSTKSLDSHLEVTTAVEQQDATRLAQRPVLEQNFANPFNSGTVIHFALPQSETINLSVYNLAGQKVASLVSGTQPAGPGDAHWDGRDDEGRALASGVYLYRLQVGSVVETRKLALVR